MHIRAGFPTLNTVRAGDVSVGEPEFPNRFPARPRLWDHTCGRQIAIGGARPRSPLERAPRPPPLADPTAPGREKDGETRSNHTKPCEWTNTRRFAETRLRPDSGGHRRSRTRMPAAGWAPAPRMQRTPLP